MLWLSHAKLLPACSLVLLCCGRCPEPSPERNIEELGERRGLWPCFLSKNTGHSVLRRKRALLISWQYKRTLRLHATGPGRHAAISCLCVRAGWAHTGSTKGFPGSSLSCVFPSHSPWLYLLKAKEKDLSL